VFDQEKEPSPQESGNGWITWRPFARHSRNQEAREVEKLRLRIFRITILFGLVALGAIIARGVIIQSVLPLADLLNLIFLSICLFLSYRKPAWSRVLSWMVLLSFTINCLDGLGYDHIHGFTPTHILLPLLVLYGALLGNMLMIVVALLFVLLVYIWTMASHPVADSLDIYINTNFMISALITGLASYGVWLQHQRLGRAINRKAAFQENELKMREQLSSVLFHDIRNPLGTLMGTAELCQLSGKTDRQDLETILKMGRRIDEIIDSVQIIKIDDWEKTSISIQALVEELETVFSYRLEQKDISMHLAQGHELTVLTQPNLLCNSVLSNLLSNAIKYTPRGGRIELFAQQVNGNVRIEFQDQGEGFPPEWLQALQEGRGVPSYRGTEGESGFGLGLGIAANYLNQIGGQLQFRNRPRGASAAILLPAGN
jgi:signal transduction histidine kinase